MRTDRHTHTHEASVVRTVIVIERLRMVVLVTSSAKVKDR